MSERARTSSRPSWKGMVSFGLVSVPVRLHVATEERTVRFHQVHRGCGARVRHHKVCEGCGEQVQHADVAKGFEYEKGQSLELGDDFFDDLPVASKKVITVDRFVDEDDLIRVAVKKSYYLNPDTDGIGLRGYRLLQAAMADQGKVAVGKVAFKDTKEQLVVIRPLEPMVVQTMFWPDEVRVPQEVPAVDLQDEEIAMAITLVENLSGSYEPDGYEDAFRAAVLDRIEAKVAGVEPDAVEVPAPAAPVTDLMEMLKASVAAAQDDGPEFEREEEAG